jgi:hypothetical protein
LRGRVKYGMRQTRTAKFILQSWVCGDLAAA